MKEFVAFTFGFSLGFAAWWFLFGKVFTEALDDTFKGDFRRD